MKELWAKIPRAVKLLIGIFGLCSACTIFALMLPSEELEAEELAATMVFETQAALVPTDTNTIPAPPTEQPTQTIETRATSSEDESYLVRVYIYSLVLQEDFHTFGELSIEAGDNPGLIIDDGWREEAFFYLDEIESNSRELANIEDVPPKFQEAHSYIELFADEIEIMADLYRRGVENLEADLLEEAVTHLTIANSHLNSALELLEEFPTLTP